LAGSNIDCFKKALKDIFAWTQFIFVMYLKKTVTCLESIYGITMQESGVSKQVSVRFEDVGDDGRVKPEHLVDDKDTQAA
jgi:chromosome segregation protein